MSSVFTNAINYFVFKKFSEKSNLSNSYFSWKNIWEWKALELVLRHGSHQSCKVQEIPGILLKFWKSPWNVLRSNSLKERFLSKHQDFSGFLSILNVTVHWLTALIFIWGILDPTVLLYSQHITGWRYSNIQICN